MEDDFMKTRYKIVSKTRFFLFITMILILLATSILFLIDRREAYSSYYETKFKEFQVIEGDTLWDIARISSTPNEDVRKVLYDIRKFNNMSSGHIYPGDIIKIPIKD